MRQNFIRSTPVGSSEMYGPDGTGYVGDNRTISVPEVKKSKQHGRRWSRGLDRTMQEHEFERFMSIIKDPKHKIAFQMQAFLGLRIAEASLVNVKDFDLKQRTFRRWNCKRKHWVVMPMPPKLHNALTEYLAVEGENVKRHGGFILYNNRLFRPNQEPHLTTGYLRRIFKEYIEKAGLGDYYMEIKSSGLQPGKTRRLHRLSTHSLRHYFGAQTYKCSRDIVLVSKLMDHSRIDVTMTYLDSAGQRAKEIMDKAFGEEEKQPIDLAEFTKVYQLYQQMKNGGLGR